MAWIQTFLPPTQFHSIYISLHLLRHLLWRVGGPLEQFVVGFKGGGKQQILPLLPFHPESWIKSPLWVEGAAYLEKLFLLLPLFYGGFQEELLTAAFSSNGPDISELHFGKCIDESHFACVWQGVLQSVTTGIKYRVTFCCSYLVRFYHTLEK